MLDHPAVYIAGGLLAYGLLVLGKRFLGQSGLRRLPGPPRASFFKGNLDQLFSTSMDDFQRDIIDKYAGVFRMRGWMGSEIIHVADTKALHSIFVKDSSAYDKGLGGVTAVELITGLGLLGSRGEMHRRQRKSLNPVFSIAHMRGVVPIFWRVSQKLRFAMEAQIRGPEPVEIDVLAWLSRAALELIGQAGMGYSFDDFDPQVTTPNAYTIAVKELTPALAKLAIFRGFLPVFARFFSRPVLRKLAEMTPLPALQQVLGISDIMQNTSEDLLAKKRAAIKTGDKGLMEEIGEGKDIMSILLKQNMAASEEDRLPESEVLAQMATFIFAGSDTTSNALARILVLLADRPDAQERLRAEVVAAKETYGDTLIYDDLIELPYLDAVIRETLRLHAPVPRLTRRTNVATVLPLSTPIRATDGTSDLHELVLARGTHVVVGIRAVNRSPAIWGADADVWRPERWLAPLPQSVVDARVPGVYANLMTFIGGNRACIGFKFSELEMKVMLCELLSTFTFAPSGKEIEWQLGAVQSPKVKGVKGSRLPMRVGLVKSKN